MAEVATHTSNAGHLYRMSTLKSICHRFNPFYTGVEFWDFYRQCWSPSIMRKSDLKEIVK